MSPVPPPVRSRPRPPLPGLEVALIAVLCLHLCFLPWALGTMHVWSQTVSLGLSAISFALMMLPRGGSATASPATRLWRFPLFWAGLAAVAYLAVQAANPAWLYVRAGESWWLEPLPHRPWLPSGVRAPFANSNPLRVMMVTTSWWLLVCSVWCGLQRRRSYRVLLAVLAGNALLLAGLSLSQHLTGTTRIFWSYLPSNDKFSASFIYPNHAGAYFNLMVVLAVGQAWWSYHRAQSRLAGSLWVTLFMITAVTCATAVIYTGSRVSISLLFGFLLLASGGRLLGWFPRTTLPGSKRKLPAVFVALLLVVTAAGTLVAFRAGHVWRRFGDLTVTVGNASWERGLARQATVEMARDRWLFGWGAGCFRHGFPLHAQNHPALYRRNDGVMKFWQHAHCDPLELAAETGVPGIVFAAGLLAWATRQFVRRRTWLNPVSYSLALGGLLLVAHSWLDFVFHNPAVLLTAGVLLAVALRWPELDPLSRPNADRSQRPASTVSAN